MGPRAEVRWAKEGPAVYDPDGSLFGYYHGDFMTAFRDCRAMNAGVDPAVQEAIADERDFAGDGWAVYVAMPGYLPFNTATHHKTRASAASAFRGELEFGDTECPAEYEVVRKFELGLMDEFSVEDPAFPGTWLYVQRVPKDDLDPDAL